MARLTRMETGMGILALVVALGGGSYMTSELHAQGPGARTGVRGGGPGRPGGRGGPMNGGPLGDLMLRRLDLSEAQRSQVKQVLDTHKDEGQALGERARTAHRALEAAITADTLNEGAVRAAATEVGNVDADMAVERARIHAEVLQVLTAEQKAQLKKLQADMQARRDQRPARRDGPNQR